MFDNTGSISKKNKRCVNRNNERSEKILEYFGQNPNSSVRGAVLNLNLGKSQIWSLRKNKMQPDGAPCHCTAEVVRWFNSCFPDKWIAIKNTVYKRRPANLGDLITQIREAFRSIIPNELLKVFENGRRRIE
ncbi:hypothetical protein NQ317_004056 [Molorchus minor]|uniref:Transposase n=1 Tax=Molorchus minor TaxID=1323400 RepID=A0ABQ9IRL1_9CUCU|nr:hypothetical protein NQ317_004056 [Molorchus minor]